MSYKSTTSLPATDTAARFTEPTGVCLMLRSGPLAASRRVSAGDIGASWFETREDALLTMRGCDESN
jgi:hypothetical protein